MSIDRVGRSLLFLATAQVAISCGSSTEPSGNGNGTVPVASVSVQPGNLDLWLRGTTLLEVVATDADGNVLSDWTSSFSSSDIEIATVDTAGVVTGVSDGSTTITVTVDGIHVTVGVSVNSLDFASVSTGGTHTCALTTSGKAYCWGSHTNGQLGIGEQTDYPNEPAAVVGDLAWKTISVRSNRSCALTTLGQACCWGASAYGTLYAMTYIDDSLPTEVPGGFTFDSVSAGFNYSCGITNSGEAYCWGWNNWKVLGHDTGDDSIPGAVSGALIFEEISTGSRHACGIVTGGDAYCWGNNEWGQLGIAAGGGTLPTPVSGDLVFQSISAGSQYSCGVTVDGDVYCWGRNHKGQLGDGSTTDTGTPILVSGGLEFQSVAAGYGHTCGVTTTGLAYCWGWNEEGQLGIGLAGDRDGPVPVDGGHQFLHLTAGGGNTCGLTDTGFLYCWGRDAEGQLGIDRRLGDIVETPVLVNGSR